MSHIVLFAFHAKDVEDRQLEVLISQASEHFEEFDFDQIVLIPEEKYQETIAIESRRNAEKYFYRPKPRRRDVH